MNENRTAVKRKQLCLALILALLAILLVVIAVKASPKQSHEKAQENGNASPGLVPTDAAAHPQQSDPAAEKPTPEARPADASSDTAVQSGETASAANSTSPSEREELPGAPENAEPSPYSQKSEDNAGVPEDQGDTEPAGPSFPEQSNAPEQQISVVIPEKAEASYERWLAAAAVVGLMLDAEDPAFTVEAVYLTGETPQDRCLESKGIYLVFSDYAGTHYLFCAPLSAERTEPGTTDIKTADLGWASFSYVDPVDLTGFIALSVEELSEEINQSLLVTVSRH